MGISKKKGMVPGSPVFMGKKRSEHFKMTLIRYDKDNIEEKELAEFSADHVTDDKKGVRWFDAIGLHDVGKINKFGELHNIHPLVLEDMVNTHQRPKIEDFEDYFFLVFKMLYLDQKNEKIVNEQVSVIFKDNTVFSFQEREGDVFEPLRERIRQSKGRIRKVGADYLVYAMLDIVVDNYIEVTEKVSERVEAVEKELMKAPDVSTLKEIYELKSEIMDIKKAVWPLREVVSRLERETTDIFDEKTGIYIRDLQDHLFMTIESLEGLRDTTMSLLDLYLSSVSFKMNDVMKVLTIISTIFIPLTFIAGIYGMNFENMPELKMNSAYFIVLGVMAVVAVIMVIFFKKKKWW